MPCLSILEPPETGGERILAPSVVVGDQEEGGPSGSGSGLDLSTSSYRLLKEPAKTDSSSIGKNSDEDGEEEGENEVQSPLKGSFKVSMDSIEEALPMRRGISSFYNGKSRSFACLADASSCSSIKTIVKPESPYSRKRRNLLAYTLHSDNSHHKATRASHFIRPHGGGISKKPTFFASPSSSSGGRSTLALAVAMANNGTTKTKANSLTDHPAGLKPRGLGPSPLSPHVNGVGDGDDCPSPLSLRSICHWRSFSLADLQQCGATMSSNLGTPDRIS